MTNVYIAAALRTPMGRFGGALSRYSAVDLASTVMKAALEQAGLQGESIDAYVFGNVIRAGAGQLIPRQAAIKAGIPDTVNGYQVDMVCSSGMMAVMNGQWMIQSGAAEVVLVGGTESMSNAGFYLSGRARWGYKYLAGNPETLQDLLERDGLSDPFSGDAMGVLTERLAAAENVSREALDEVALRSNQRAAAATQAGAFDAEIVPMSYRVKRETKTLSVDEGIRADTTSESLAALRPAFAPNGVLTAGNASQISDGAAALVLATAEACERLGLVPLAEIVGSSTAAGPPERFPAAPIPALQRLAQRTGIHPTDADLIENNEAFALNTILMERDLGVDPEKLNVHGGAIAMGHPIGCSGARILVTLIHALKRADKETGLASICHGTGGGTAVAVRMVG
jgi:acetyl-CoA C-acetyltransferase